MKSPSKKKKRLPFFFFLRAFEIHYCVFSSTFPVKIKEAIDACYPYIWIYCCWNTKWESCCKLLQVLKAMLSMVCTEFANIYFEKRLVFFLVFSALLRNTKKLQQRTATLHQINTPQQIIRNICYYI